MIRPTIYRIAAVATATLTILAGAGPAYAAEPQILAANDLPTIITNITTWVVGLLIGVATLFLAIGGLRYLSAGGDPPRSRRPSPHSSRPCALAVLAPILLAVVKGWIGG